jgi:hypothetical protein
MDWEEFARACAAHLSPWRAGLSRPSIVVSASCRVCRADVCSIWIRGDADAATLRARCADAACPALTRELPSVASHNFDACSVFELRIGQELLRAAPPCRRCELRAERAVPHRAIRTRRAKCAACRNVTDVREDTVECGPCSRSLAAIRQACLRMRGYSDGALFIRCCSKCGDGIQKMFAKTAHDVCRDVERPALFSVRGQAGWPSELIPRLVSGAGERGELALFRTAHGLCDACVDRATAPP